MVLGGSVLGWLPVAACFGVREHLALFPLLMLPNVFWDVWGSWLVSQRAEDVSCCSSVAAFQRYPQAGGRAGSCANRDEGALLPTELPAFRLKWLRRDEASQSRKLRLFFSG